MERRGHAGCCENKKRKEKEDRKEKEEKEEEKPNRISEIKWSNVHGAEKVLFSVPFQLAQLQHFNQPSNIGNTSKRVPTCLDCCSLLLIDRHATGPLGRAIVRVHMYWGIYLKR